MSQINQLAKQDEAFETEVVTSENTSTALVLNEQDLQHVKKNTEKELKLRQEIYADIQLRMQYDQAIRYQDIVNEQQKQNFIANVRHLHNSTMNYLDTIKDTRIWKSTTNKDIYFRITPYGKKNKIISDDDIINFFYFPIKIYNNIEDALIYDNTFILVKSLLDVVHQEIFVPTVSLEFFIDQNIYYRNTFEYSRYLSKRFLVNNKRFFQNKIKNLQSHPPFQNPYYQEYGYFQPSYPLQSHYQAPSISEQIEEVNSQLVSIDMQLQRQYSFIQDFIHSLCQNEYQFNYIMNWLANYFQKLMSSKIALVLHGDERTTSMLINYIIKPIFAAKDEYWSFINDDMLKKTKDTILNDKIFYHIGEFSNNTESNKKVSELVLEILQWKNNQNHIDTELVVTSTNESPYRFLKDSYSRCSVFKVKHLDTILKEMNIDRISLIHNIESDLENFSNILAQYPLQQEFFYIADTPENKALPFMKNGILRTEELNTQIDNFIVSIKEKKFSFFKLIEKENQDLYQELIHNFDENMIAQPLLSTYFNIVHKDIIFEDNSSLLEILKEKDEIFRETPTDQSKYNGKKRYSIS